MRRWHKILLWKIELASHPLLTSSLKLSGEILKPRILHTKSVVGILDAGTTVNAD
jgi:hypothetical protein